MQLRKQPLKIAIVGSGIAGIAASIRLAHCGHSVSVFEANDHPGGKLSEICREGYRFDAGPSLFTLPELVDELFELCGERANKHFNYKKLDVTCNYFYEDGTRITAFGEPVKFIEELSHQTSEKSAVIKKAIDRAHFLYARLSKLFMFSSLNDPKIYFSKEAFKAYLNIARLGFFQTMNSSNDRLFKDPRLVQLFNRYATYNGSNPYKTPATMNIIPHLEISKGAYFPKGGMYKITEALVALARRQGVSFHFNSPVEEITVKNKVVSGVRIAEQHLHFDRVVSNMDIVSTYRRLLRKVTAPKFLLNQPKSSSAIIFYWGIRDSFQQLDLHNILFSSDYRKEFDHIFTIGDLTDDPTVYINITAKHNPKDAPTGCENWFTMINAPNNQGQDWESLIEKARQEIINKISRMLKVDITPLIEVEEILDPRTIESKTSSSMGALYGNSSNNLFAAFLRHANKSRRVKNLYFCGGSVHPGGGIPMSLSSAKIMARYFE